MKFNSQYYKRLFWFYELILLYCTEKLQSRSVAAAWGRVCNNVKECLQLINIYHTEVRHHIPGSHAALDTSSSCLYCSGNNQVDYFKIEGQVLFWYKKLNLCVNSEQIYRWISFCHHCKDCSADVSCLCVKNLECSCLHYSFLLINQYLFYPYCLYKNLKCHHVRHKPTISYENKSELDVFKGVSFCDWISSIEFLNWATSLQKRINATKDGTPVARSDLRTGDSLKKDNLAFWWFGKQPTANCISFSLYYWPRIFTLEVSEITGDVTHLLYCLVFAGRSQWHMNGWVLWLTATFG